MKDAIVFVLAGIAIVSAIAFCNGCKPPEVPLPDYCYDEQKLTGALVACARNAPTKEMWLACRTTVNASCGFVVSVTDGGTP